MSACVLFLLHTTPQPESAVSHDDLVAERHAFQVVQQAPPVISEHLRILHTLLRPVLIPPRDVILSVLEMNQLIAKTFLDEYRAVVLVDNGFLVLLRCVSEVPKLGRSAHVMRTYLDDCLDYLLCFAGLDHTFGLGAQGSKLGLVR